VWCSLEEEDGGYLDHTQTWRLLLSLVVVVPERSRKESQKTADGTPLLVTMIRRNCFSGRLMLDVSWQMKARNVI
jgi:hypothetical protein